MSDIILRAESVGKLYKGGNWGVRDVSVECRSGKLVALLGANGAGKSTLLGLLTGMVKPSEGRVLTRAKSGRSLGWCGQSQTIDWYLSVFDNVYMGARFAGFNRAESRSRAHRALDEVGLGNYVEKQPDQLSGGQQQRIQVARALVHSPSILFLDEPTTGLDLEASEMLVRGLAERAKDGAFVMVSSHDLGLVDRYCDEVLLLFRGSVLAHESRESFIQRFAGDEVVEVTYEGELPEDLQRRLSGMGVTVVSTSPLEILVPSGYPLGQLLGPLTDQLHVVDIRRRVPGLSEAYRSFQS